MKNITDNLMALQRLQGKSSRSVPDRAEKMTALRSRIPELFLGKFDRLIARQKKPVSVVRNGVCSECHIQIAVGILASLAFGQGSVQQCGNCGRFLFLPQDEPVFALETPAKRKAAKSRKETTAQAALSDFQN